MATALAATVVWIPRSFAWTRFNPTVQLGCLVFSDPRDPKTETLGLFFLFVLGAGLLPVVYAWLLIRIGGPSWATGMLAGGLHGLLTLLALPLLATFDACVRAGLFPAPGWFGVRWGRATPAVLLVGHLIYGTVIAVILAGF